VRTRAFVLGERPRLGRGHKTECRVGRAGLVLGLGGGQRAPGSPSGVRGESRRVLQEGGGRRHAAAGLRAPGGALELTGYVLVGLGVACARCQARRSGSVSGSVASASARCASRRSAGVAAR